MIVVLTVVCLLAMWTLHTAPQRSGRSAKRISCTSNLKQVGLAFRMWSNDHAEQFPWQAPVAEGGLRELTSLPYAFLYFAVASNELNSPRILVCPADKERAHATTWFLQSTNLSYFVGLSATETNPNAILSGDRNLTTNSTAMAGFLTVANPADLRWTKEIHQHGGNIGLSDGSVSQVNDNTMAKSFKMALITSTNENVVRLVIP